MSLNGPPMAAICCATGVDRRPVTIMTTPKQSISPARNAAVIRRTRVLRVVMSDPYRYLLGLLQEGETTSSVLPRFERPVAKQLVQSTQPEGSAQAKSQWQDGMSAVSTQREGRRLASGRGVMTKGAGVIAPTCNRPLR